MKLTKIRILNYKSIKDLTIEIKQLAKSYTTIFVGRNETGKSNILEAIKFLSEPDESFNFEALKNAQNDNCNSIDYFYTYSFDNESQWRDVISKKLLIPDELTSALRITAIEKNIRLSAESKKISSKNNVIFNSINENILSKYCYRALENDEYQYEIIYEKNSGNIGDGSFKKLSCEDLSDILNDIFTETMEQNRLNVSEWKYSKQYLITKTVDLNEFKEDNSVSYPLKNIFKLANFSTQEEIKAKIESLLISPKNINKLEKILENTTTEYINKIWPESKVTFKFKIQNDLHLSVYVVDDADEENSFYMSDRSEGFKQFISMILSISAENSSDSLKNNVIIIDEPEIHMHPSGIKYMCKELMRIGENNYVFIATHSEFMIDTANKERHYIVTKRSNNTHVAKWESGEYMPDDEVLRQAFGISIMRDFLSEYNFEENKELEQGVLADRALKVLFPELNRSSESEKKEVVKKIEPKLQVKKETIVQTNPKDNLFESSGALAQKFKDIIEKTKHCLNSDTKLKI